ncbi:hypothetical protein HN51_067209 [Arachis hypogaea]
MPLLLPSKERSSLIRFSGFDLRVRCAAAHLLVTTRNAIIAVLSGASAIWYNLRSHIGGRGKGERERLYRRVSKSGHYAIAYEIERITYSINVSPPPAAPIDSFAAARDNEMHEATRRILSVLLRQIDGFEQDKKVVVIAATNRKEDLDPALISRFDTMIPFGLPDHRNRQQIVFNHQNVRRHLRLEICHEMGKKLLTMEKKGSRRWMSGGSNRCTICKD